MLPAITDTATTRGCSRTAQLITSGCSTCPSNWPMTTMSTSTAAAVSGPRPARATTVATPSATGEPTRGTNAAKNSSRVSGSASGTRRMNSTMPTRTALVAAMMMMPRVYPAKVRQAARPARSHTGRAPRGSSRMLTQLHSFSPEWMKNTEANSASAPPVITCTTRPRPDTALLNRLARCRER